MRLNPEKLVMCPEEDKKIEIEFEKSNVDDDELINLSFESNQKDLEIRFNPQSLRMISNSPKPKVTAEVHANSSIKDGIYYIYIFGTDEDGPKSTSPLEVEISDNYFNIDASPGNLTLNPGGESEIKIELDPHCYNGLINLKVIKPSFIEFNIDPNVIELFPQRKVISFEKLTVNSEANDFGNHIIELDAVDENGRTRKSKIDLRLMKDEKFIPIVSHPPGCPEPVTGNPNDTLKNDEIFEEFILNTNDASYIISEFAANKNYKNLTLILDSILQKDVQSRNPCDPQLTVWVYDKTLHDYKPLAGCNGICHNHLTNVECPIPGDPKIYIIDGKIKVKYVITDPTHPDVEFFIDYQSLEGA